MSEGKENKSKDYLVLSIADFRELVFGRPVLRRFAAGWIPDIELSLGAELTSPVMRHCIDEAEHQKPSRAAKKATSGGKI